MTEHTPELAIPTPTKRLSIKKPRSGPAARRDPQKFHHNAASKQDLERIRESYRAILGREVSLSLVVRRGLAVLAERLDAVRKAGAEENELAALARHLR